jgi:16S rRNA G966 N2-methylase RsmD
MRWRIGRHFLACANSRTIEGFYPQQKCDLVFTDPPFEMKAIDQHRSLAVEEL